MLLNSWAAALLLCHAAALFLILGAVITALRVIRQWDVHSDSDRQIRLEQQTWLGALLVRYGMTLQILSLVLLVMAADGFAPMLAGAMCAAGVFAANDYGFISLSLKIIGVFLYGFWLLLHQLDLASEEMVLTRGKFVYLLLLLPLVLADCYYGVQFLYHLEPDIITSCCGILFGTGSQSATSLLAAPGSGSPLVLFYTTALVLVVLVSLLLGSHLEGSIPWWVLCGHGLSAVVVLLFVLVSLYAITVSFSPYIYALPSHRCPFDIIKPEYGRIGLFIYLTLFGAGFTLMSGSVAPFLARLPGLAGAVERLRRRSFISGLLLLVVFLGLVSYYPLRYQLTVGF